MAAFPRNNVSPQNISLLRPVIASTYGCKRANREVICAHQWNILYIRNYFLTINSCASPHASTAEQIFLKFPNYKSFFISEWEWFIIHASKVYDDHRILSIVTSDDK